MKDVIMIKLIVYYVERILLVKPMTQGTINEFIVDLYAKPPKSTITLTKSLFVIIMILGV